MLQQSYSTSRRSMPWHFLAGRPTPPPPRWKRPVNGFLVSDLTSQLHSPSPTHSWLPSALRSVYLSLLLDGNISRAGIQLCSSPALFMQFYRGFRYLPICFSAVSRHVGEAHFLAPLRLGEAMWLSQVYGLWESAQKAIRSRECSCLVEPLSAWDLTGLCG